MPFLPEDIVTRYWAGFSHPRLASEAVFEVEEDERFFRTTGPTTPLQREPRWPAD